MVRRSYSHFAIHIITILVFYILERRNARTFAHVSLGLLICWCCILCRRRERERKSQKERERGGGGVRERGERVSKMKQIKPVPSQFICSMWMLLLFLFAVVPKMNTCALKKICTPCTQYGHSVNIVYNATVYPVYPDCACNEGEYTHSETTSRSRRGFRKSPAHFE